MNFLKMLVKGCSHRFYWPRVDKDGHHYQICAECGTAYEYDWKMMRRTQHVVIQKRVNGNLSAPLTPNTIRS